MTVLLSEDSFRKYQLQIIGSKQYEKVNKITLRHALCVMASYVNKHFCLTMESSPKMVPNLKDKLMDLY